MIDQMHLVLTDRKYLTCAIRTEKFEHINSNRQPRSSLDRYWPSSSSFNYV